jgi:hypothetical protein
VVLLERDKRIPYFEKQTGDVAENKGSDLKNKAEQTEKQSGSCC